MIRSTTWIYGEDRVYADSKHVFQFTSLLIDCKKLGGGRPGNEATYRLGTQVSRVINTRMFLRRLDEVCQLLHEVGQLLYEVHLLTASGGVAGGHNFSWKV